MCEPITSISATQAMVAMSVVSVGLQFYQGYQQQKSIYKQQQRQNDLARKNAVARYASEQLRIKQVTDQSLEKGYQQTLKAKKARAEARNVFGERNIALRGSAMAVYNDYYRKEGNYMASLSRNLKMNYDQYDLNMKNIQLGYESQATYLTPPDPVGLLVNGAVNVASTYFALEAQKEINVKGYKQAKQQGSSGE